jgi:hypothetical protein
MLHLGLELLCFWTCPCLIPQTEQRFSRTGSTEGPKNGRTLINAIYGHFQSWTEMYCTVCSVIFSQKMVLVT